MTKPNRAIICLIHQLLWCYFCIYNVMAKECPHPCTCEGSHNLTVNCSNLLLVNLPMTSTSTLTLDLSNNSLGPIINASFVQMRNLSFIDLSHNGLVRLLGCTFSGMLELRTVRLRSNRLTTLPDSLFTDANKVEHLDISFNHFTELPDDVFRNTPQLKTLDVSHNFIGQLKLGATFQVPRRIQAIDLSHNHISLVQRDSFEATSSWETNVPRAMTLAFSRISSVEDGAFSNIPNLNDLDLSGNNALPINNLVTLVKDLETRGLERLSLAYMNLTTIVPLFAEVSQLSLKFLNVSFNSLTDMPENVFSNIRSLRILDLSRNSISKLADGFSDLAILNVLNISHNRMESFQGNHVTNLSNLQTLDLSNNKLDDSSRVNFSPLSNLNYLKVNNNMLNSAVLPNSTSNLKHLDYHANRITQFRGLDDATMLEYVDVSNNDLRSLPGLLFKGARFLKLVNFSRNNITTIDHGAFLPQSSLVIDLSYNLLKELRYKNWVATQKLYLNHNELVTIDNQAFYGMTGLEVLRLSQNKLTTLHEDVLQYLTNLKHLNLSHNLLDNVDWFSLFRSLELLVTLDLGNNKISHLNESMFLPVPKIQVVSLRDNHLPGITPHTLRDLKEIKYIDLSNNPFDCSCDYLAFREWLKETQIHILGLYKINSTAYHCRTPYFRAGIHVTQWDSEEFECDKAMLYVIVFCSTLVLLTLVGLASVAIYRFYRKWKSRRAEVKRDMELEEERSKRAKKVDFVRLSTQKIPADDHRRQQRQGHNKFEDTDRRNGYVPWPGNDQRQYGRERSRSWNEKGVEKERIFAGEKSPSIQRERNGGRHYERLKRGEGSTEELDKQRRREKEQRSYRQRETSEQVDSGSKIDRGTVRPTGRKENEHPSFTVRHEGSSHEIPSQERQFYSEKDPRYKTGPYIISSANTFPKRLDGTHAWGIPHGWTNHGYMKPRGPGHGMDDYMTIPIASSDIARQEREIRPRERASERSIDRYPLEVHFDDEMESRRYIRLRGDDLGRRQRSYSYNYLPEDYAHDVPFVKMDHNQRNYESIEHTRRDAGFGHRAFSQPYLANEGTSGWL